MTNEKDSFLTKGTAMKAYLINQRNGCGAEQILADTPEEACEIYRATLTAREGAYQMHAILSEAIDDIDSI